jgi:hypothetical protein
VSPLGDPAWVASLRGPDPSKPSLNIGGIESAVPRSGTGEKDRIPDSTFRRGDSTVRNGQILSNGRVYLIGAERSTLSKAGAILLAPGRAAELGDLRVPFVRVYVAAPTGVTVDVDQLVSKRPAIGMFNALFAPAPARQGETGDTAIASATVPAGAGNVVIVSMKDDPAGGASGSVVTSVAAAAPVAERSVALLPVPPANVEERMLAAFSAPIEERSGNLSAIPPASVEERSSIAIIVPVEDRSGLLAAIPPASVTERSFIALVAPTEERSTIVAAIPPANVVDRSFLAFVPSVEDHSGELGPIPPASVIDRSFAAKMVAVADRSAMLASIPPASVVERGRVSFVPPVVDKGVAARPLVPAHTEDRIAVRIALAEARQVPLERAAVERAPEQIARIGKPLPSVASESGLVAARNLSGSDTGVVQVALHPPVVIVTAKGDAVMPRETAQAPVKLAAVQKRLPSVMIDRRGGLFFM